MTETQTLNVYRPSAGELLDLQIDLIDRLMNQPDFEELIKGTLSTWAQAGHGNNIPHIPPLLQMHAKLAARYRVSADMVTMIEHAASQLENTDCFTQSLLPTPAGIVRFDRPLVLIDVRGNQMLIHAMTWGPALVKYPNGLKNTTLFSMWNDPTTQTDVYSQQAIEMFGAQPYYELCGRWSFIGSDIVKEGTRVGSRVIDPHKHNLVAADDVDAAEFTNVFRYFVAFLMLLKQKVVRQITETPTRGSRRRAQRAGIESTDVTTIDIRRSSPDEPSVGGTGTVEWSRRWVVRGHWRNAKVGKGRQEVERVWVTGHVKGPQDKPLIVSTKIYDVK